MSEIKHVNQRLKSGKNELLHVTVARQGEISKVGLARIPSELDPSPAA